MNREGCIVSTTGQLIISRLPLNLRQSKYWTSCHFIYLRRRMSSVWGGWRVEGWLVLITYLWGYGEKAEEFFTNIQQKCGFLRNGEEARGRLSRARVMYRAVVDYRGMKLMIHAITLWERVAKARIRREVIISQEQYGFKLRKRSTDAMLALRMWM